MFGQCSNYSLSTTLNFDDYTKVNSLSFTHETETFLSSQSPMIFETYETYETYEICLQLFVYQVRNEKKKNVSMS